MPEEGSQAQGQNTSEGSVTHGELGTREVGGQQVGTGEVSGRNIGTEHISDEPIVVKEGKKGISQADLNKAAGKARDEGRQAATNELLRELGIDSPDTLKQLVQERKEAEEARMTELDKLQKQHKKVAEEKAQYESQVGELQGQIQAMQLAQAMQVQLVEAGVNPERLRAASRLVDTDGLSFADDGSVIGLTEAIDAAKAEAPELFQTAPRSVGSGSNPPVDPPDATPGFDQMPSEEFAKLRQQALLGQYIPLR